MVSRHGVSASVAQGHHVAGDVRRDGRGTCGVTAAWVVLLTCHRAAKHDGCHLDVDADVWYDDSTGEWRFMPRLSGGAYDRANPVRMRKGV